MIVRRGRLISLHMECMAMLMMLDRRRGGARRRLCRRACREDSATNQARAHEESKQTQAKESKRRGHLVENKESGVIGNVTILQRATEACWKSAWHGH